MFDAWLRALKDRLFASFARRVGTFVHPGVVTVLACAIGLLAAWAAADRRYAAALALWVLNRALDGLDGSIARVSGRAGGSGTQARIAIIPASAKPAERGAEAGGAAAPRTRQRR